MTGKIKSSASKEKQQQQQPQKQNDEHGRLIFSHFSSFFYHFRSLVTQVRLPFMEDTSFQAF